MSPTKTAFPERTAAATLATALLTRTRRAVADVTRDVDDRTAADAVSASSDALVLVRLLEQPEVLDALRAADALAPARLRGIEARAKLVDLAGGLASSEEASAALGLTRQAIEKRRRAGRLLALSLGKRGYRYPVFQFGEGRTLPGLERVLDALEGTDAWTALAFFVNRRAELGDRSPVELLRIGQVDAVIEAAGTIREQGAA
jgi:hypothetical protein